MSYIYKFCGKLSMVFYVFMLYQFWHLCQYGGLRNHFPKVAVGIFGFVFTLLLRLAAGRYHKKADAQNRAKKKVLYAEIAVFLAAAIFFGGRIIYSAIPYHGALSWKVYEWMHKKEIRLEHGNIYEYGVEGILSDLDVSLKMPEELYISNKFQIAFDEGGKIQRIDAFLYGKDEKGYKNTYLIAYDAKSSDSMTVWTDGNVNGEYEEDMCLSPMVEIMKKAGWAAQVKEWTENLDEPQIYEVLYLGRRSFPYGEGLRYIPGDADGDGIETGTGNLEQLKNGGEIVGFEVSLHIPGSEIVTPVRYIMEPEYISQEELQQENAAQQIEETKNAERWTTDESDGTMYFFLDSQSGWRLVVTDAAAGSRYYVLEKSADGGTAWERINEDPFGGEIGVAEGLVFFDEKFGVIGIAGASQSHSSLYITRDGGASFEKTEFPVSSVTELPAQAKEYGFTAADYDYFAMPEKDGDILTVTVTTDAGESSGIIFKSTDGGITWEHEGIVN